MNDQPSSTGGSFCGGCGKFHLRNTACPSIACLEVLEINYAKIRREAYDKAIEVCNVVLRLPYNGHPVADCIVALEALRDNEEKT
jgi:hypothetical protein